MNIKNVLTSHKKLFITLLCIVVAFIIIGATGLGIIAHGSKSAMDSALKEAGIEEDEVDYKKSDFDFDNGSFMYEIEFTSNGIEYEYKIRAKDGKILKKETEVLNKSNLNNENSEIIQENNTGNENNDSDNKDNNITLEKAKEMALEDAGLSAEEVEFIKSNVDSENQSIYDIEFIYNEKEYDYEIDKNTGLIVEKNIDAIYDDTPITNKDNSNINSSSVTLDEAKDIALKDAGISSNDATFSKTKLENDDNQKVYDIEFFTADSKYEYEILMKSGEIVDKNLELINNNSDSNNTNTELITIEKAKNIAIQNANCKIKNITFTKQSLDIDDGIYVYDFEFYANNKEFECEINAYTGKIINFGVENTKTVSNTNKNKVIEINKAKEIAVEHAGTSSNKVAFIKAKLENDDGNREYEIEFIYNGLEYEYTIDAYSGEICEYDVDD